MLEFERYIQYWKFEDSHGAVFPFYNVDEDKYFHAQVVSEAQNGLTWVYLVEHKKGVFPWSPYSSKFDLVCRDSTKSVRHSLGSPTLQFYDKHFVITDAEMPIMSYGNQYTVNGNVMLALIVALPFLTICTIICIYRLRKKTRVVVSRRKAENNTNSNNELEDYSTVFDSIPAVTMPPMQRRI